MKIISDSPQHTVLIGQELGKLLRPGYIICLEGDLGAGKTHFAKGIALGNGVEEHVTSPTFTIINEYEGRLPLYHVDAYRLEDEDEAFELGLEEYLFGQGVTLIEWPQRIEGLLPEDYMSVYINYVEDSDTTRVMEFKCSGSGYSKVIEELKAIVCPGD